MKISLLAIGFFFVCGVVLLTGCQGQTDQLQSNNKLLASQDHSFATVSLNNHNYRFEVVNTPTSTTQGLSGRDQIGSDGLLFIFPRFDFQQFWMKEMKFDLDFVWLANLKIVDLTANVPHPASVTERLPIYSPKVQVNEVLELPAGTISKWQLTTGDTFVLSK